MEGPGADSEEKRVLASDLDTVMVDSLKALDFIRPIREADISGSGVVLDATTWPRPCMSGPFCRLHTARLQETRKLAALSAFQFGGWLYEQG